LGEGLPVVDFEILEGVCAGLLREGRPEWDSSLVGVSVEEFVGRETAGVVVRAGRTGITVRFFVFIFQLLFFCCFHHYFPFLPDLLYLRFWGNVGMRVE